MASVSQNACNSAENQAANNFVEIPGFRIKSEPSDDAQGEQQIMPIFADANIKDNDSDKSDDSRSIINQSTENSNKTVAAEHKKKSGKILFKYFFKIIQKLDKTEFHRKHGGVLVECLSCKARLQGSFTINSNFLRHLRLLHYAQYKKYESMSKRRKRTSFSKAVKMTEEMPQSICLLTEQPQQFAQVEQVITTQQHYDGLLMQFLINNKLPLATVEDDSFLKMLSFANPNLYVMSKVAVAQTLNMLYSKMVHEIKATLSKNNMHVAVTADACSHKAGNFCYLLYTCHWLDECFQRNSIALACKRFAAASAPAPTDVNALIACIQEQFELSSHRIRAEMHDNFKNYAEVYKKFGFDVAAMFNDAVAVQQSDNAEMPAEDVDDALQRIDFVHRQISTAHANKIKCFTHELSALATEDFHLFIQSNKCTDKLYREQMEKCIEFWRKIKAHKNKQQINQVLKVTLPNCMHWISLYDALRAIVENFELINQLCQICNALKFSANDLANLKDYLMLFKPVADAVNFLQQHPAMTYGLLLPTLATLRLQYWRMEKKNPLRYYNCELSLLLKALQKRFKNYFELKHVINDAIVASVVCPDVKLKWLRALQIGCNDLKITKVSEMVRSFLLSDSNSKLDNTNSNAFPLLAAPVRINTYFDFDMNVDADVVNTKPSAALFENEYCAYLADPLEDLQMLNRYPRIKEAYLKYNAPLTTAVAVEQSFSYAKLCQAVQSTRLSDDVFEKMFLLEINKAF